jgi:hypothetical protein
MMMSEKTLPKGPAPAIDEVFSLTKEGANKAKTLSKKEEAKPKEQTKA